MFRNFLRIFYIFLKCVFEKKNKNKKTNEKLRGHYLPLKKKIGSVNVII